METSLISLDSNVSNISDSLRAFYACFLFPYIVEMYLGFSISDSQSYNKHLNKETLHSLNFKI